MTDFEKFLKDLSSTKTIIVMRGDWTDKTSIIRRVNGFAESAIITYAYDWIKNETTVIIKE